MKNVLLLFIIFFTTITFAQDKQTQSKELYASALKAYQNNEYKSALSNLQKAIEIGGGTNKYIEVLKVNCFIAQKEWENAKSGADNLFKSLPNDKVLNTLSLNQEQINTKYKSFLNTAKEKKQKEIQAKITILESKKEQAIDNINSEIAIKNKIIEVEAKAKTGLNTLENLKEGYLYSIDKPKISSNPDEKSYFVFYGDEYLIFTIPTKEALTTFADLNTFDFKPNGKNSRDKRMYFSNKKIQTTWFRKTEYEETNGNKVKYIEYINGKNVAIPLKYSMHKENSVYYYYKNGELLAGSHVGFNLSSLFSKFDDNLNNPYIETGKIEKVVNNSFVNNEELKIKIKANHFKETNDKNVSFKLSLKPHLISTIFLSEKIIYKTMPRLAGIDNGGKHLDGFGMYYPKEALGIDYIVKSYSLPLKNIPITNETLTQLSESKFDELDFRATYNMFNSNTEGLPLHEKYFKYIVNCCK